MKKIISTLTLLCFCLTLHTMDTKEEKPLLCNQQKKDNQSQAPLPHKNNNTTTSEASDESWDEGAPLIMTNSLFTQQRQTTDNPLFKSSKRQKKLHAIKQDKNKFREYIEQSQKSSNFIEGYNCSSEVKNHAQQKAKKIITKLGAEVGLQWNNSIESNQHNCESLLVAHKAWKKVRNYCAYSGHENCSAMGELMQHALISATIEAVQNHVQQELDELDAKHPDTKPE